MMPKVSDKELEVFSVQQQKLLDSIQGSAREAAQGL